MKQFSIYLLFAYLALTVQAIFFQGIKPDLVLVLVCFYALRFGQLEGIVFGTITGMLIDSAGGSILGPNILGKAAAAFLITTLKENLFQWNIYINTLIIMLLSVLDVFLTYICYEFFSKISFADRPLMISVTQIFYTSAASVILYVFLKPGQYNLMAKDERF